MAKRVAELKKGRICQDSSHIVNSRDLIGHLVVAIGDLVILVGPGETTLPATQDHLLTILPGSLRVVRQNGNDVRRLCR